MICNLLHCGRLFLSYKDILFNISLFLNISLVIEFYLCHLNSLECFMTGKYYRCVILISHVNRNVQGKLNYFDTYMCSLCFSVFILQYFIYFILFVMFPDFSKPQISKSITFFFPLDTMTPVLIINNQWWIPVFFFPLRTVIG